MNSSPLSAPPALPDLEAVLAQIRTDATAGQFLAWGGSTLIDEFTGVPSISRELFDELHVAADLHADFPVGNAGLLHVYGYWFSQVPTPFGYKRDRWVTGELARALGRPTDEFLLRTDATATTLARVTSAALPVLLTPPAGARVADAEFSSPVGLHRARVVLHAAESGGPTALVYGISDAGTHAGSPLRLITAFPVSGDPELLLADFERDPGSRWNAVADW
ncbi:amino acid deaminase [Leucobacter chromiireducens]|uniref:Amino acid deaminase n=1 Tax=Leucobacter chromiireducens subsp. chromiireducens TaxID=660067 RepID=A0ABS1SKE9_9MICO|nr:amino acid deaminase [Leucobacter chromiireducens]MBL3688420.1 amino acid deaminase [Leucobacter chromiireducens subsp. chromiireducens]